MTREELRCVCNAVGKDRLARLLDWSVRTLDRKLSGQHKITKENDIAVRAVLFAVAVMGED